jgi:AAA family ATP:ADP antiporter
MFTRHCNDRTAQDSSASVAGSRGRSRLMSDLSDERICTVLFACHALLLLICYYIVKTLREPLLLVDGSAELKSYGYAVVSVVLLILVPVYAAVSRRCDRRQLTCRITAAFVVCLAVFGVLARTTVPIGFAFFVWSGAFGVMMLAQFWAHASAAFNAASGRRLIPTIMGGAALGGLIGPLLAGSLFPLIGSSGLIALAAIILAATMPLVRFACACVPQHDEPAPERDETREISLMGGLALVLGDRFLMLLALLVVLSNCVNTLGDFILTGFVLEQVGSGVDALSGLSGEDRIAGFFGMYYAAVNALSLALQVGLAARVVKWLHIRGALLVLPILAGIGYGMVAVLPVFVVIQLVKLFENSTDYSIMNTTRQLLYLPAPESHKFEGKAAIETLFWRFGDLIPAAVVYLGLHWFGMSYAHFAIVNVALAAVWIVVSIRLGRMHDARVGRSRRLRCSGFTAAVSTALLAFFSPAVPARLTSWEPGDADNAVLSTNQPVVRS